MTSVRNNGAALYDDEEAALYEAPLYGDEAALCSNEASLYGGAVATDKTGVGHDVACVCNMMATDWYEWYSLGAGAHDALSAVATMVALADR